eukprot:1088213_1
MPLYWYSDANQAARFKQYDENACDQDWYDEPGQNAHSTCHWVLPEYGGGSHCDLFWGSCSLAYRAYFFCADRKRDRCWFETEGICGGNSCVTDGHCEPIFARKYDYQGAGFVEGMNGAATTYSRYTKEIWYLLPMGAHFDERTKVAEADRDQNGKYFTLMLEYFDANHTQTPLNCWSLYDGNYHEMDVILSEVGDLTNGFSRESYSVMFTSIHEPITRCRPYAFICKTSLNNFFRLPEEGDYYFGTEWIDWQYTNFSSFITQSIGYTCKENHYYHDGTQWIVNGGPELDRCGIWYYQDTDPRRDGDYFTRTTCNGCQDLDQLDCWAECIYSDFATDKCHCAGVTGPDYGNEWCHPDLHPTHPPTPQSEAPTPSPTPAPTLRPTLSPLKEGFTHSPSLPTVSLPTVKQTARPTKSPFQITLTQTTDSGESSREGLTTTASPGGGIAAAVLTVLVCIICIFAYVYFRKKSGKPWYPSSLKLPQIPTALSNHDSNVSRQLSMRDAAAVETPSVVQIREDVEGDAFPDMTDGYVKGLPPRPPEDVPPVAPLHMKTINAGAYSYRKTGTQTEADADKKTPLSGKSSSFSPSSPSIKMNFPPRVFMSIEDAKQIKGADKEKFLNDQDFVRVFEMTRDEFDKLPKWKQVGVKKDKGFF